jgi:cyclohexadienyl dehydratase
MKFGQILLIIVISAAVAFPVAYLTGGSFRHETTVIRSAMGSRFDTIKQKGVLNCGYINEPPFEVKDPNTGQLSGMAVELTEEIAKQLNIKINWASEVSYGQMLMDLAVGRYDMICAPFYALPSRAREATLSMPLFYFPAYLYARKNDRRFDNNYARADDPKVKFAILDGNFSSTATYQNFPKAAKLATPEMASVPELFVEVAAGKADVVVSDPASFASYDKNNPGKLRTVVGNPLQVMAGVFLLPAKEEALKNAIDSTLAYLQGTGYLDKLLRKYETPEVKFLDLATPYKNGGSAAP